MQVDRLRTSPIGHLVAIRGHDPRFGEEYDHWAFVPSPLPEVVELQAATWALVADAMHALGRLDQVGGQVPNPMLLRRPTLRREAQSTSALEGTYAPLSDVLEADLDAESVKTPEIVEILNYVLAAEHAFAVVVERPVSVGLLYELHRLLVRGTRAEGADAGRVRSHQVVIGPPGTRVEDAGFVPMPAGPDLEVALRAWVEWVSTDHTALAPVVQAALAHYQFETLHPFNDGNGRIGRLLVVVQLLQSRAIHEPLLTVSPWFERRRRDYQDALQAVSETGEWDPWVAFFAEAIRAQAVETARKVDNLLAFQAEARVTVRERRIRGIGAQIAEDLIGRPIVTPSWAARHYGVTYPAANTAIDRLVDAGLLRETTGRRYARSFACDPVIRILER